MSAPYRPIPGDRIRFAVFTWYAGQLGITTYHTRVFATTGVGCTLDEIAQDHDSKVSVILKPIISDQVTWLGIKASCPTAVPAVSPGISLAVSGGGGAPNDPLPTQVSGILTLQTGLAGPARRGRMYIPFPTEDDSGSAQLPSAAYITGLDNMGAYLVAGITSTVGGNTTSLIAGVWSEATTQFYDLTGTRSNPRWATQRRRGMYGKTDAPFIT